MVLQENKNEHGEYNTLLSFRPWIIIFKIHAYVKEYKNKRTRTKREKREEGNVL